MKGEGVEYPIVKRDGFGRVVWQKNSSTNEVFREYWGDTNITKVIYRKFNQDYVIDVYDINSNHIIEVTNSKVSVSLKEDFIIKNREIKFNIKSELILEWEEKLNKL